VLFRSHLGLDLVRPTVVFTGRLYWLLIVLLSRLIGSCIVTAHLQATVVTAVAAITKVFMLVAIPTRVGVKVGMQLQIFACVLSLVAGMVWRLHLSVND
jgi:hypothetical protein